MTSSSPLCDLCLQLYSTNLSEFWCFLCNKLLCPECERKHRTEDCTKDHELITIDEYQKLSTSVTSVKQVCSDHNQLIEFYCKYHDLPCCSNCVASTHKKCWDIKPLHDAVRNVKESYLIEDLQNRMEDIPKLSNQLIEDLTNEKSRVNSEIQRIVKEVINLRANIDQHLDMIQGKLLEQIKTSQDDQFRQLDKRLAFLKNIEDKAKNMRSDFKTLVQYCTNSHIYLTMKTIEAEITKHEDEIRADQTKHDESFDSMKLKITPEILRLTKAVEQFGFAEMLYRKSTFYCPEKEQQGQKLVSYQSITLKNIESFVIEGDKETPRLTGCCITESGELIIADFANRRLVQTTAQGKLIKNIDLRFQPRDVKPVDKSTVAVSSYLDNKIVLVDTKKGKTLKTVYKGEECCGFSYKDGIYTICTGSRKEILMIDSKGKIRSTIRTNGMVIDCSVKNDKLYYIENETVVCSDMKGTVIWKFRCNDGDGLAGIVIDQSENLFIVCRNRNKVVWIDKSGNKSRIVLSKDDGMDESRAIYLCEKSRSLLVCNGEGSCFFYNLC